MGLDIRLPIGAIFTLYGIVLSAYGLLSDASIYARSLGININLYWGVTMLVFGCTLLVLSRRGTAAMRTTAESVEGLRMEESERARGLEAPARDAEG